MINELVVDQNELFTMLDSTDTSVLAEQYLREVIMVKAEDAASYITVENSFISAHFDFKF